MIIRSTSVQQVRKELRGASEKPIIVQAGSDEFNRKLLESGGFDVLLSVEGGHRNHSIRQVDSGFNHVLGKIATKNNVAMGIDLKELRTLSEKEKAQRLARITQNIMVCKKTNTALAIYGVRDDYEARAFLLSLGASTQQAKRALVME